MLKVLQITSMYPSEKRPAFGAFVKSQIDSLRDQVMIDLVVVQGLHGIGPYVKSVPELRKKLKGKYDLIHVHYGNLSSLIKLLYFGNTPIITSYCGDDLLGSSAENGHFSFKHIIYRKINRYLSKRDFCSIVKSENLAKKIEKYSKRIEIIPNGVNVSKFETIEPKVARRKLGLAEFNGKVILFPADPLRPGKNYKFLKDVLNRFEKRFKFKVLFFNEGKVDPEMVPYYYYASDVVVFPSLSEGSPNVIKEAMACNCKILSSPCGDVEWLLEGVKGSKILPLQKGLWVQALYEMFTDKMEDEGSNAKDQFRRKRLATDEIASRILNVYKDTMNSHNL